MRATTALRKSRPCVASAPNPSHGPVEIGFDLREPAAVEIRVIDVAGRLIANASTTPMACRPLDNGVDGSDTSGQSVAAGVYYVRVSAADRDIGQRKVVMLR
jgi:hypothetical protein